MSELTELQAWVARAEEDYLVAVMSLRRKQPLTVTACFHAQQCAEKYLKALLLAHDCAFPRSHDLRLLSGLCNEADVWVDVAVIRLDSLSFYAVNTRYPGEGLTLEQARDGLKTARVVRRFARMSLGLTG